MSCWCDISVNIWNVDDITLHNNWYICNLIFTLFGILMCDIEQYLKSYEGTFKRIQRYLKKRLKMSQIPHNLKNLKSYPEYWKLLEI